MSHVQATGKGQQVGDQNTQINNTVKTYIERQIFILSAPPQVTSPPATVPASTGRIGKTVASKPFDLLEHCSASGHMGDIGDITIVDEPGNNLVRMTYQAEGREPHEWDNKYIDGEKNSRQCGFAGIMLLDGNWGRTPGAGYDLRGSTTISWEARSLTGNVFVRFLAGGANWAWGKTRVQVAVPHPDSLPGLQLGQPELTGQWQRFAYPLDKNVAAADLQAVVALFGWIISLSSNEGNGGPSKKFTIEVRNISYALPFIAKEA